VLKQTDYSTSVYRQWNNNTVHHLSHVSVKLICTELIRQQVLFVAQLINSRQANRGGLQ